MLYGQSRSGASKHSLQDSCRAHNGNSWLQENRASRGPQPRQGRVGRLSLIVVDSMSALLGPVLGSGQYGYGQALLTSFGHTLKQAAASLSGEFCSDACVLISPCSLESGSTAKARSFRVSKCHCQWLQRLSHKDSLTACN